MRISIITAVRNTDVVERALLCLPTTGVDLECIVIDGDSTDGTSEIIQKHLARIDVYHREGDTGIYSTE